MLTSPVDMAVRVLAQGVSDELKPHTAQVGPRETRAAPKSCTEVSQLRLSQQLVTAALRVAA